MTTVSFQSSERLTSIRTERWQVIILGLFLVNLHAVQIWPIMICRCGSNVLIRTLMVGLTSLNWWMLCKQLEKNLDRLCKNKIKLLFSFMKSQFKTL